MTVRKTLPILSVFIALFGCRSFQSVPVQENARVLCENFSKPRPWSYCLTIEPGASRDLLYYLHGAGQNERSWYDADNYTQAVRNAWKKSGKPLPSVASISFGGTWLLTSQNNLPESGLMDVFTEFVIPVIESRFTEPPERRLLMGESMGGFNAAQLVLFHGKLFSRAALLCPGLATVSPYGSDNEIQLYIHRTRADPAKVARVQAIARLFYPDAAHWEKAAPLLIGAQALDENTPALYISCSRQDEYGFFEGARAFSELARAEGVAASWEPLDGPHCTVKPESVAAFLHVPGKS